MRNPWFHFRQFSLRQDQAAMKICTDACVFGAWTAKRMGGAARVLDIGTGTGLLTLILAQEDAGKNAVRFEAIEMDPPSVEQAAANFAGSPWAKKIGLHQGDVVNFEWPEHFDFAVINPPFYEGQLHSPLAAANQARHETGLTLEKLLMVLNRVLTPAGRFAILLPASRETFFAGLADLAGYRLLEVCHLKQTPDHEPFRSLMLFARTDEEQKNINYRPGMTELVIRDRHGNETPELLGVMKDYYIR